MESYRPFLCRTVIVSSTSDIIKILEVNPLLPDLCFHAQMYSISSNRSSNSTIGGQFQVPLERLETKWSTSTKPWVGELYQVLTLTFLFDFYPNNRFILHSFGANIRLTQIVLGERRRMALIVLSSSSSSSSSMTCMQNDCRCFLNWRCAFRLTLQVVGFLFT